VLPFHFIGVSPPVTTGAPSRAFIVTVQVALFPPDVAVIVAVPTTLPVTTPLLTVAILVLLELHVTVLFVAFDGFTVAVNVSVASISIVVLVLFKLTDVTSIAPATNDLFEVLPVWSFAQI
jgi:hypothetical protein